VRIAIGLALLAIALLPAPVLAGANRDRGQDEVGPGPDASSAIRRRAAGR
jgi:hypothetical protein